jgi:hypothetical protein
MSFTKQSIRPSVIAISAAVPVALMLVAGFAPASSAAPLAHIGTPLITQHTAEVPALKGVGGGSVITCTAKANNPHDSHHVGGTVNFVGQVNCTAPVSSIQMTISLSWDNYLQKSAIKSNAGNASISNNVAAACTSGGWQGTVVATVTMPPGYVPQSGVVSDSNIQSISC